MDQIIDQIFLTTFCLLLSVQSGLTAYQVVPLLITVSLNALFLLESLKKWLTPLILLSMIFFWLVPGLPAFTPVLVYTLLFRSKLIWPSLLTLLALVRSDDTHPLQRVFLLLLLLFSAWLSRQRQLQHRAQRELKDCRLQVQEAEHQMAKQKQTHLESQKNEVLLARQAERIRISRDMHDSIGHVLASALLQTGALQIQAQDGALAPGLEQLQQTLQEGMSQARATVHDLRDQARDLDQDLRQLLSRFTKCPVKYTSHLNTEPDENQHNLLLAIVREALTNISRHSDATQVSLTLRELPGFYQLRIQDNGRTFPPDLAPPAKLGRLPLSAGMGLRNMVERTAELQGQIRFSTDRGFGIFVTLPRSAKRQTT